MRLRHDDLRRRPGLYICELLRLSYRHDISYRFGGGPETSDRRGAAAAPVAIRWPKRRGLRVRGARGSVLATHENSDRFGKQGRHSLRLA